jgi:polyisoprenoid-binding protein YceI
MRIRSLNPLALAAALLLTIAVSATAARADVTFNIDPGHSLAEFTAVHFGITKVRGSILVTQGTVVVPPGSYVPTAVSATLNAASLDSRNADRDEQLHGPEWLDVTKYPTITFKSTQITPGDQDNFKILGDLTIHGVTKQVTLDAHFDGTVAGRRQHASYSASTTIDRFDFGLNWAEKTPGGTFVVGNEVEISITLDALGP